MLDAKLIECVNSVFETTLIGMHTSADVLLRAAQESFEAMGFLQNFPDQVKQWFEGTDINIHKTRQKAFENPESFENFKSAYKSLTNIAHANVKSIMIYGNPKEQTIWLHNFNLEQARGRIKAATALVYLTCSFLVDNYNDEISSKTIKLEEKLATKYIAKTF